MSFHLVVTSPSPDLFKKRSAPSGLFTSGGTLQHYWYNAEGFGNYTSGVVADSKPKTWARHCLEVKLTMIQTLPRLDKNPKIVKWLSGTDGHRTLYGMGWYGRLVVPPSSGETLARCWTWCAAIILPSSAGK